MRATPTTGPDAPAAFTASAWAARSEDEPGELVDGQLVEEEMPDLVHEAVVLWLAILLGPWLRERGGRMFGSEVRLQLSTGRGRKADLVGWFPGHRRLPARGAVAIPPDPRHRSHLTHSRGRPPRSGDKADDDARFGVRWYWLIDPDARTLEVFELQAGRYVRALAANSGRLDLAPGCPGLVLDLNALWADVDDLVIAPS